MPHSSNFQRHLSDKPAQVNVVDIKHQAQKVATLRSHNHHVQKLDNAGAIANSVSPHFLLAKLVVFKHFYGHWLLQPARRRSFVNLPIRAFAKEILPVNSVFGRPVFEEVSFRCGNDTFRF